MSFRKNKKSGKRKIYSRQIEETASAAAGLNQSDDDEEEMEKSLTLFLVPDISVVVSEADVPGVFEKLLRRKSTYNVQLLLDLKHQVIEEEEDADENETENTEEARFKRSLSFGAADSKTGSEGVGCSVSSPPTTTLESRRATSPKDLDPVTESYEQQSQNRDNDTSGADIPQKAKPQKGQQQQQQHLKPEPPCNINTGSGNNATSTTVRGCMTLATPCDIRRVRNLDAPEGTKYFAFCYGATSDIPKAPNNVRIFCEHGGFVFFDKNKLFIGAYRLGIAKKNAPRTDITFDLQKCLDLPLDEHHKLFTLPENHPLFVSNCNKYHFQMQLLGRRVGLIYYQHTDQDEPCVYEIVTRSRRADTNSSFSSQFHRPLSRLEGKNDDNLDGDETWTGGQDEFSRLCDEFVNNFRFEGMDPCHIEFKLARHKTPTVMENCELRLQGKRVQLRNDNMAIYFDLKRPVRRNECGEFPGEGNRRGQWRTPF